VDGTLWFAHAIGRYLEITNDVATADRAFVPALLEIIAAHRAGTRYGIRVDDDGLLRAGEPGVQLTWMDAKVGDWVVTPRIGKPVEVNALWIEALETAEAACGMVGREKEAEELGELAAKARASFERRFWNEKAGCLYDLVDGPEGDDASIRPNQIIALSFPDPAIGAEKARAVLEVVRRELLTPYGLRSLSPADPRFVPRYEGNMQARDGAYHQGTVWPWLMGPFVKAWLKVHGKTPQAIEEARGFLKPLLTHLTGDACLGQVSEIFDATPPFTPRGCIAQAWSVAVLIELLAGELA